MALFSGAGSWLTALAGVSAVVWIAVLVLPWRPWSTRERLDLGATGRGERDFSDTAVLIPARDEAGLIARTLGALARQGRNLSIILVDDHSSDGTAAMAARCSVPGLILVAGASLPEGWSGKVWALEQARRRSDRPVLVLLDADVELADGLLESLRQKMDAEGIEFASLMAELSLQGFWAKLLNPAFVYFFKLLYPFALSNDPTSRVAAAAGGCIMLRADILEEIGGLESVREDLIDDCALAKRVKSRGRRTWIGLTHEARSLRPCDRLSHIWHMVSRTAYTQLRYSIGWLGLCTGLMTLMFLVPTLSLFLGPGEGRLVGLTGLLAMSFSYLPVLRYYRRSWAWVLALPIIGMLYLTMTWTSAIHYWGGRRSRWKGRQYLRSGVTAS